MGGVKKKAVFVISTFRKDATPQWPITDVDMRLMQEACDEAGIDGVPVFAVPDMRWAGKEKYLRQGTMNANTDRLRREIAEHSPDYVFVMGVKSLHTLFGSGRGTLKEYRRKRNVVDFLPCPFFVTDSLSRYSYQPGIGKWIKRDVKAAVDGYNEIEWPDTTVIRYGDEDWDTLPSQFNCPITHVGFDLETYPGTNPWHKDARIRMAILSIKEREAVVVQAGPNSELPKWVLDICKAPWIVKGGSNIAFDMFWMHCMGYDVNNVWDTESMEHLIDCTDPNKNLKYLAFSYAPWLNDYDRPLRERINKIGGWEYLKDEEMYKYAGGDGDASYCAMVGQEDIIKMDSDLTQAARLWGDLYPVLTNMQIRGLCVDRSMTERMDTEMDEVITELRAQICEHLGPINPNSPTQLAKALFDQVKGIDLRKQQWRKALEDEDEEASTCRAVLEREADKHPVIPLVLEHRIWTKAWGAYVDSFLRNKYRGKTGIISKEAHLRNHGGKWWVHSRYLQARTETFRLASADPNAQQFPRKGSDERLNVKRQFISRFKGGLLLNADYAQMEMRVAAQESGDTALLEAINSGDIHTKTAQFMMQKQDITEGERQAAKAIGFGTIYGAGAGRISKMLGIPKARAAELIGAYFRAYPQLRAHIDRVFAEVPLTLSVTTPFGFTRKFLRPPFDLWDKFEGARIRRQAYNTIIQSTAACIMYCALIEIERKLAEGGYRSMLVGTVHDSLMVDMHPEEVDDVIQLVRDCMSNPPTSEYGYEVTVPLEVDLEAGENWGSLEKIS